ncbi:hypothetical protein L1887_10947 [Cichorium endivia]|nr:hypothetical protein L1887_10947 [Cichorium endivia]
MATVTGNFFRHIELPQQKPQDNGVLFPAVLSTNHITVSTAIALGDFGEAIRAHKPWVESSLKKSGAILFRDYPSPSDFNNVVEAFGYPELPYMGGRAARTKVIGRVYSANESPPEEAIPFHHEMAYIPDFPTKLFFFCDEEPGAGGETPIVLSHIIYDKMKEKHPEFVAKLEEHELTYTDIAPDEDNSSTFTGRGWKSTFKTDDKKVAVERAAKLGGKLEWIGNAAKVISAPMPAISFGNGDPLPDDVIEDNFKILDEECVAIPWKKDDILFINKLMVLHGRRPLLKPPRRILASLCE